ncbi:GGDEF domain-containing protein [Gilvimarinus sp. 1_MG-2023]|uniref:GGDEF domain-containing protein n=1 Tax=Gilvimarinus sp. 1_MG-2023 TaxID=3062638 RepID=UPI0026E1BA21|nr:GGDEF domain-containing protein [Gilvimarinus sp. 1_MG-2023]MDO6746816.1 GGDEF domain-containing protein [Gilvimarinus sp. 1_MG-2023]
MPHSWRLETVLLLLVLATALSIFARDTLLRETLIIEPGEDYSVRLYDDGRDGGSTEAVMLPDNQSGYQWQCDLRADYQYPYCGFEIRLVQGWDGLDLSSFDKVELWLDYSGGNKSIRIFLRNYDIRYSNPNDETSTKHNQIEFSADRKDQHYEFSFSDFFVANWWLLENDIPPNLSHPQFDNIISFDVQTGSEHKLGVNNFHLKKVKFIGQRIDTADWYLAIISIWSVLILGFLAYRIVVLSKEVRERQMREKELLAINKLLDFRSQELEVLSKTDHLTGAFNRQGIEGAIKSGLSEWRRDGKSLSVVMIDIDYFKAINDNHGHAVGDAVLAGISQLVQERIRSSDLFARWGGEEFVLVCRDTSMNYAAHIAEKLRRLIEECSFADVKGVTASFGVASLQGDADVDDLFKKADEALYRAKRKGRNRVEVSDND